MNEKNPEAFLNKNEAEEPDTISDPALNDEAEEPDTISDPALNDEVGQDWTDEGGATPNGAALDAE